MSTDASAAKGGGKKKLLILLVIALLVLAVGGAGAVMLLKKKAAAADDEDGEAPVAHAAQRDPKHPPAFLPLDMFTVNLADRDAERYAQIGIVLEVTDAKAGDELKAYMPAIRNNILMVLAHKTSQELLVREGKERLAFEVQREASRALGIEIDDEDAPPPVKAASAADGDEDPKPVKKKRKKKAAVETPIKNVQFSNFIIQ